MNTQAKHLIVLSAVALVPAALVAQQQRERAPQERQERPAAAPQLLPAQVARALPGVADPGQLTAIASMDEAIRAYLPVSQSGSRFSRVGPSYDYEVATGPQPGTFEVVKYNRSFPRFGRLSPERRKAMKLVEVERWTVSWDAETKKLRIAVKNETTGESAFVPAEEWTPKGA